MTSFEPVSGSLTTRSAVRAFPAAVVRLANRSTLPVTASMRVRLNRLVSGDDENGCAPISKGSTATKIELLAAPELSAVRVTDDWFVPACSRLDFAGAAPFAGSRMTKACPPPLAKKCSTECDSELVAERPPKPRSKSPKFRHRIGRRSMPESVGPTNSATDVGAPATVRTPEGSSWVYTPG